MDILLQRHKDFKVRHDTCAFTPAPPRPFSMTRPVLDIRGHVVHRDETLILDRLDWRVRRGAG